MILINAINDIVNITNDSNISWYNYLLDDDGKIMKINVNNILSIIDILLSIQLYDWSYLYLFLYEIVKYNYFNTC